METPRKLSLSYWQKWVVTLVLPLALFLGLTVGAKWSIGAVAIGGLVLQIAFVILFKLYVPPVPSNLELPPTPPVEELTMNLVGLIAAASKNNFTIWREQRELHAKLVHLVVQLTLDGKYDLIGRIHQPTQRIMRAVTSNPNPPEQFNNWVEEALGLVVQVADMYRTRKWILLQMMLREFEELAQQFPLEESTPEGGDPHSKTA